MALDNNTKETVSAPQASKGSERPQRPKQKDAPW